MSKDNMIKNIANKFSEARHRLKGHKYDTQSTPKTPAPGDTRHISPHEYRKKYSDQHRSVSPRDSAKYFAKIRTSSRDFEEGNKTVPYTTTVSPLNAAEMAELRSQYSSEKAQDYITSTPRIQKFNMQKALEKTDPFISPISNPFDLSDSNR